jgi:hypothetical protein
MTPGDNGASTPEDEDPFGYLYADGQARGAQPPSGGYGYPNSVSRVRTVGERQYGQQPAPQQQGAFGQSGAYQAPETLPGGAPTGRQPMPGAGYGGGRGRGPNTKGLLIGAIAVVAAVVIGITVAMVNGNSDGDKNGGQAAPSTGQSQSASADTSAPSPAAADLPKIDAKSLQLGGSATTASDVKGAKAAGGVYVSGFNAVGSSVTWNVDGIPSTGKYTLYVGYGVPGKDASATLTINGTPSTSKVQMKNWAGAPAGDYSKGWTHSFNYVQLNKGTNSVKLSCEAGDQCDANIDQLWLVKGWVQSGG